MNGLALIDECTARDCYNATRPLGSAFWHELPAAERQRLISFAKMVAAVDRSWVERQAIGRAAREMRTRFLVIFHKIQQAIREHEERLG